MVKWIIIVMELILLSNETSKASTLMCLEQRTEIYIQEQLKENDEDETGRETLPDKESFELMPYSIVDPLRVFICHETITISFNICTSYAEIRIINESTGEIVHEERCFSPVEEYIELFSIPLGEYQIEIETGKAVYTGFFNL